MRSHTHQILPMSMRVECSPPRHTLLSKLSFWRTKMKVTISQGHKVKKWLHKIDSLLNFSSHSTDKSCSFIIIIRWTFPVAMRHQQSKEIDFHFMYHMCYWWMIHYYHSFQCCNWFPRKIWGNFIHYRILGGKNAHLPTVMLPLLKGAY